MWGVYSLLWYTVNNPVIWQEPHSILMVEKSLITWFDLRFKATKRDIKLATLFLFRTLNECRPGSAAASEVNKIWMDVHAIKMDNHLDNLWSKVAWNYWRLILRPNQRSNVSVSKRTLIASREWTALVCKYVVQVVMN